MLIPKFWAEARVHQRIDGRHYTVRRLGWSDDDQAAAQRHADERAQDALRRVSQGERLVRREPKVPYDGAQGVPIREEIISRDGDVVITRNSYGAQCLNTPDVLFSDIDFDLDPPDRYGEVAFGSLFALAGVLALAFQSWLLLIVGLILVWPLAHFFSKKVHALKIGSSGGHEKRAMAGVTSHLRANPDWNLRVYRTPAGYRILVMHRTFEPREPAVTDFFETLGVDPDYARLCKLQDCFRARVSPKPWRIGMKGSIRPRSGTWPVPAETLARRTQWISEYEHLANDYASCQLVGSLGSDEVDAKAEQVRKLHDAMSRSDSKLALA